MIKVISRLSAVLLTVLAAFYLAACIAAPEAGIQVVSMVLLKGTQAGFIYQYVYTAVLVVAAVAASLLFMTDKWPGVAAVLLIGSAKAGFVMTAVPLGYSYFYGWKPGFYEYYVGEALTIVATIAALMCAVMLRRKRRMGERE